MIIEAFYLNNNRIEMTNNSGSKKSGGGNENPNAWMITFSDLVTLLLTFFVLLFSFTSMDDKKLKISFQNFSGSTGILSFNEYRELSMSKDVLIESLYRLLGDKVTLGDEEEIGSSDTDTGSLKRAGNYLAIKDIENGFKIALGVPILFPSGDFKIKEEAKPVLDKIARFISLSGYQAYIDGHTDNTATHTARHSSNEELSIARALSIRDYLTQTGKIPPHSAGITGYGALKPIAPNNLPSGKAKNRRVEIILKSQRYF